MKRYLYVTLPFFLALLLRLYPMLISDMPFSTDAWPLIRNTELLLGHTPIHLGNNEVFDGYNNFWPANTLFGAVFSQVTGLEPVVAMGLGIPLAGALTVLIFYVLVNKATGNIELAFIASLILATAFPYSLFTAGVTKETYANPLYMLCILLFLTGGGWRKTLLFIIASTALVMAHHLTAFVTIAVLASVTLAATIVRVWKGLNVDKFRFLHVSILTVVTALYFWLYAWRGLKVTLTFSDWLSAGSYQVVTFSLALYFTVKHRHSHVRTLLTYFVATAFVFLFAFLCTQRSVVPGAPTLPTHYLLYVTPFILISPVMVLGFGALRIGDEHGIIPVFWLATILGLEGYAVFGDSPAGLTLAYRTLNFLCLPLAVFCAAGLHRLHGTSSQLHIRKLARVTAAIFLALIVTLNSYNVYAAISLQERYMGYFWLYRTQEFQAGAWIRNTVSEQTVAGDVKVSYLLKGYFNLEVDTVQGLLYLTGKGSSKPHILFSYNEMLGNGYVVYGGYSVDLPKNWTERTFNLNLIYSNGLVKIHSG